MTKYDQLKQNSLYTYVITNVGTKLYTFGYGLKRQKII